MPVVFSHTTALEILYSNPSLASQPRVSLIGDIPSPKRALTVAGDNSSLSWPIHIVCKDKNHARATQKISPHIKSEHYPEQCLLEDDRFLLSSPEQCFVQMASLLPLQEVILLGFFLCGDYRNSETRQAYGDRPLAKKSELAAYLRRCDGAKGAKKGRQALKYVLKNSNSPMESRLAALFFLPPRLGGYGFEPPILNGSIGDTGRKGDLCWIQHSVVLEYDSKMHHSALQSQERDSIRSAEIQATGIDVISVTWAQASNLRLLDTVAAALARKMGVLSRKQSTWQQHMPQRIALHRKLFHQKRNPYFGSLPI